VNQSPVPTLSLAPKTINVGGSTTATVGASDPDNAVADLTCSVNWGNGAVGPFLPCTTSARNFTYTTAGLFTVTVTARDPAGATGTVSDTIRVLAPETNTPPEIVNLRGFPEGVASYRLNANGCYSLQQVCIKYTIRDVDAGDTPFRTTVNWGDGTPTYVPNSIPSQNIPLLAYHNYAAVGTYTVTVTATDRRGASSTQTISIRIDP
jgi:PKD repeat protein